jgi:signal transduction histidine kinase
MNNISDSELMEEVINRLKTKDKAIDALMIAGKKLEELNNKLVESERVKTDFLSNIRNEINNPLTSVLTLSRMITKMSSGESISCSELISLGNNIYKESFNLNFQLQNIFAAAEIEAGEIALSISSVNIGRHLLDIVDSFSAKASEKGLIVNLDGTEQDDIRLFKTDPKMLEIIISNLLSNAIEYSNRDGIITITAWNEEGMLRISVKDNGIGIDEKDHRVIFDRFKQLDTGATKNHPGHGLGLSIVKAMLELLSGTISVISKKKQGATFIVSLPWNIYDTGDDVYSSEGKDFFFEDSNDTQKF